MIVLNLGLLFIFLGLGIEALMQLFDKSYSIGIKFIFFGGYVICVLIVFAIGMDIFKKVLEWV